MSSMPPAPVNTMMMSHTQQELRKCWDSYRGKGKSTIL